MKYFYILCFLFSYSVCSAQDPELFENTWYLHKLNIENIDYLPPDRGFPNSHGFTESENVVLEKQVSVDVSNLSMGIYFLNIKDKNGSTAIKKFTIE